MSRHYSDPERENDKYALPDVEVFHVSDAEFLTDSCTWMAERMAERLAEESDADADEIEEIKRENAADLQGWYYWFCFPGCLPEGEPFGPFATEAEALADARNQ